MIAALAERVGAEHPAFAMSPREIIDWTLGNPATATSQTLEKARWLDLQPPFEEAHFLDGFGFPDGKFRFKPDWTQTPLSNDGLRGAWRDMPPCLTTGRSTKPSTSGARSSSRPRPRTIS